MGKLSFVAHSLIAVHPMRTWLSWQAQEQLQHGLVDGFML